MTRPSDHKVAVYRSEPWEHKTTSANSIWVASCTCGWRIQMPGNGNPAAEQRVRHIGAQHMSAPRYRA